MGLQKHSTILADTVEQLSDEASYKQLFHAYRDEEALPSGEVLKETRESLQIDSLSGYYGNARISKQTIRFQTGVNIEMLHERLSGGRFMQAFALPTAPARHVRKKK